MTPTAARPAPADQPDPPPAVGRLGREVGPAADRHGAGCAPPAGGAEPARP